MHSGRFEVSPGEYRAAGTTIAAQHQVRYPPTWRKL
jgi:hypothetical protein